MNSSLASSPSLSEQETPTAVPRPPQITPFYPQPILPIGWVNYEYFITRYQTALTPEEQSRSSFQLFEITNGTHEPDLKEFWLKTAMSHRSTEMFALAAEDIIGYRLGYGTPRNKGSKQVLEMLEEMGYDTSMEGGFDLAWQAVKKGSPRSSQQISYHLMKPDASTCFALQKTMDKHGITFTDSLPYRLTAIALYGGNGHAAHTYAEHSNSHRLLQENPGKFPPSPDTEQYAEWIGHLGYNINDSKLAWRLRVIAVFGKNPKSAEKCKKILQGSNSNKKEFLTAAFENIGVPVNKKLEITLDVLASKLTDKRAYTYQQISLFHENATAKLQRHVNANKPQTVDKLLDFNYEF